MSDEDWKQFAGQCSEVRFDKRSEVFTQARKQSAILFVASGICAAQLTLPDGHTVISRFFESKNVCSVVEFQYAGQPARNSIVTVTPVEGALIPIKVWGLNQFEGGPLARYVRQKMFRQHLFDIDMLHMKTMNRTEVAYEFLKERHPSVLKEAPQTVIAQFCGITPEGYSRFLKNYSNR
ncbi:MAG: hypothetical protein AAGH57_14320 [Pseudomonadota bacterium]